MTRSRTIVTVGIAISLVALIVAAATFDVGLLVLVALVVLAGVAASAGGYDSRDGRDWPSRPAF